MNIHFEDQDFDFDFNEALDVNNARFLKRNFGLSIKGLRDGLSEMDADAIVALYWLMLKFSGKTVDPNKVNFNIPAFAEAFAAAAEEDEENPTQSPQSDETNLSPTT